MDYRDVIEWVLLNVRALVELKGVPRLRICNSNVALRSYTSLQPVTLGTPVWHGAADL